VAQLVQYGTFPLQNRASSERVALGEQYGVDARVPRRLRQMARVGPYKILIYFKDFVWESIILAFPPPPVLPTHDCNTIARLLRNTRPLPGPSFGCNTPYNISNDNMV